MERVLMPLSNIERGDVHEVLAWPGIPFGVAQEKFKVRVEGVYKDDKKDEWHALVEYELLGQERERDSVIQAHDGSRTMFIFLPLGQKDEQFEGMKVVNIEHGSFYEKK